MLNLYFLDSRCHMSVKGYGVKSQVLAWLLREDAGLPARGFVFGVPQVRQEVHGAEVTF